MARSTQLSLGGMLAETLRTLKGDFFNPYRPELHYMRGPGPKWREKHELRLQPLAAQRPSPGVGQLVQPRWRESRA
jgi:hypothetical protein